MLSFWREICATVQTEPFLLYWTTFLLVFHKPYLSAYGVCEQNRFISWPHPTFKKKDGENITRGGTNAKNPFWCVLLRLYSPPRPPSNPANESPDVGKWAGPRPRRGSGSVAASLQQENRLLGFVWWMWMSSITSFRDVDGYLDVATFSLGHPETPSHHR